MSVTGNLKTNKLNITGPLTVGSNTILNARISDECRTALSNLVIDTAWKSSYGNTVSNLTGSIGSVSVLSLPYNNNVFTPVAAVHLYKNGDECQYQSGILSSVPANSNLRVEEDTQYYVASITKTATALLYARFKTLNIIPPGNSTTMEYFFPNMSNMKFFVPSYSTALSTYIVTPATRKLYLDDIFSESVGFNCGFDGGSFLNPVTGGVSGATSSAAYNATKSTFYGGLDALLGTPYNVAWPYGYLTNDDGASNLAVLLGTPAGAAADIYKGAFTNPDVNFEGWLNYYNIYYDGSNLQLYDHGKLNYNSSENFGTAVLTRAYHRAYPASNTMSYFEILRKELLIPLGSGLIDKYVYGGDANYAKIAAVWQNKPGFYKPDPIYDLTSPFYSLFYTAYLYLSQYHKNAYGNSGLIGTLSDYSKLIQVIARKGLLKDGRRLINASEIANLFIPRVTADEDAQFSIAYIYGVYIKTFALAGLSRGPSYEDGSLISPGSYLNVRPDQGILKQADMGRGQTYSAPLNEYGWIGASGIHMFVCPDTETCAVMATMEGNSSMSFYKFYDTVTDIIQNEYFNKGVNIYTAP